MKIHGINCRVCGVLLTTENRYKTAPGICRQDFIKKVRSYNRPRSTDKDKQREYVKRYGAKNDKTDKRKKQRLATSKHMYALYPEKWKARAKLRYAVKKGEIAKPNHCEEVNLNIPDCYGAIHAHHYLGYEGVHWADVKWLCVKHHGIVHRKI